VSCFSATGSGIGIATGICSGARESIGGAMSDAGDPGAGGRSGRNICVNAPGGAGAAGETGADATAVGGGGAAESAVGRTWGSGSGALLLGMGGIGIAAGGIGIAAGGIGIAAGGIGIAAGGIGIAAGGIGIKGITGGSGAATGTAVRASSQSANMFSPSSARVITVHPRSVTVVATICAASGPLNCARRAVIDARASGDESISTWASTESPATVSSAMYVRMPSCCAMAIDNR
jgi:hypothetical protein